MLYGKNILITGASKGLGAYAARSFAEQGAKLFLVARSINLLSDIKDSCRNKNQHKVVGADLTKDIALEHVISTVQSHFKQVDIIVHCIGGGLGFKEPLLSQYELEDLHTLNIGIAAEINRQIIPDMMERRSGNIVHVGSIASSEGIGSVGYNVVKAALAAYVRSLGNYLNAYNVICTGILPGGFISPGNSMARLKESNEDAYNDFIIKRLPRSIMGDTEELIPMLNLLCSEDASMMGGCMVPIDAGEGKAYA